MIELIALSDEIGSREVPVEFFTFPDGSRHVKVSEINESVHSFIFQAGLTCSDDIVDLMLLKDALNFKFSTEPTVLFLHYMLGARQDRVVNKGEALSSKVYAGMINSCNFTNVIMLDPHSDVMPALLNNCAVATAAELYYVDIVAINAGNSVVVSPDAGGRKRAESFAKAKGIKMLVAADKTRDLETGKIVDFNLYAEPGSLTGRDVFIVDDIVTNGGTFLGLLEEILTYNEPNSTNLVVTHADHDEGLAKMCNSFDSVYVTNSRGEFETAVGNCDNLIVISVTD